MSELSDLDIGDVHRVESFKRDELISDPICCESSPTPAFLRHEKVAAWPRPLDQLARLDRFRDDWLAFINHTPFAQSRFIAFEKAE